MSDIIPPRIQTPAHTNQSVFVAFQIMEVEAGCANIGFNSSSRCQQNHAIGLHGSKDTLNFHILRVQASIQQLMPRRRNGLRQMATAKDLYFDGVDDWRELTRVRSP